MNHNYYEKIFYSNGNLSTDRHIKNCATLLLDNGIKTLRFPNFMEEEFKKFYAKRYRMQTTLALMLGLVVMMAFTFIEFSLTSNSYELFNFRSFILVATICATIFCMINKYFRYHQLLLSLLAILVSSSLIVMLEYTKAPYDFLYFAGLYLVIGFSFTVTRMRFWYSVATAAIIAVSYFFADHLFTLATDIELNVFSFTFILAISISLLANYFMELSVRANFLHKIIMTIDAEELSVANSKLQDIANTDSLTQVANRRLFDSKIAEEWRRCLRNNSPISLLIVDVDFFKDFNDKYGHFHGDSCLSRVAAVLAKYARRPGDLVARYGGEEFAIILPDTNLNEAELIANELCKSINNLKIVHEGSKVSPWVSVSIGVDSIFPSNITNHEDLINNADYAMYTAKNKGRNQVVINQSEVKVNIS